MVSLSSPVVLVLAGSLAAVGAALAGSRRGHLAPVRATLLVSIASFWAMFALLSLSEFFSPPASSLLVFAAALAFFTGVSRARRWWDAH